MIRILITVAAYRAIGGLDIDVQRKTGADRYGPAPKGMVAIWLDKQVVNAIGKARGPVESMSEVIIRLAAREKEEAAQRDARDTANADRIDGYDRDNLGESPDY